MHVYVDPCTVVIQLVGTVHLDSTSGTAVTQAVRVPSVLSKFLTVDFLMKVGKSCT